MIKTLLIANRGEIACRIIRSARELGIQTVTVYSDADRNSRHVREADQAVHIGPAPAQQSYLNPKALIQACHSSGADALHPGYGFLAENANFARACGEAGICFVGPPPEAMELMGTKREALLLMAEHGIPILPGYHSQQQDDDALIAAAGEIGYPLMIKPSAGGGGKGMQVVTEPSQLPNALAAARRIAQGAFADDNLILERYLEQPRHIEVQILADAHGNCIHLFERDCSLQRRHQKILEEAPAADLPANVREQLGQSAVNVARAVGYENAGTVEFLYDSSTESFYFMEMNTRLQVEHPVTEMILGLDLVAQQLHIAAGQPLEIDVTQLYPKGHAIEVRLYAEDPRRNFLPAAGTIEWLDLPEDDSTRIDSGIEAGDQIGIDYDPMLAKLIVHGPDRASAQAQLRQALATTSIGPVATNLEFLRALSQDSNWLAGPLDTGYIDRTLADLDYQPLALDQALALACIWIIKSREAKPDHLWAMLQDFRLNLETGEHIRLRDFDDIHEIQVRFNPQSWTLELPTQQIQISRIEISAQGIECCLNDEMCHATVHPSGQDLHLLSNGLARVLEHLPLAALDDAESQADEGSLYAPMPGKIVRLHVSPGDMVSVGQELLMLEAMKMEHSLYAPSAAQVGSVHCKQGDLVEEGSLLLSLQQAAEQSS